MKTKLFRVINRTIQVLYYVFIAIPILFVIISLYSYIHVRNAIGEEPTTEDYVYPAAISKHVSLHIPSREEGKFLIGLYACSIVFFFVLILLNLILRLIFKPIQLHFRLALLSALINIFSMVLVFACPPIGWYMSFVLD